MTSQLVGQDFTGAAQLPKYVNGRLLSAEDLATSQATLRGRDQQIGRAAGRGVVSGLWVTHSATTVTVAAGLGINSAGEPVKVGTDVTLPLTLTTTTTAPAASASFGCCNSTTITTTTGLADGCYLLTALPACQTQGTTPMAPATPSATAGCVPQWTAQGVAFKAIPLPLGESVLGNRVWAGVRRNLLAHWCFGAPQLDSLGVDPFSANPAYSGFDQLDPSDLTCADLPLAVFYWNGQSLDFVDNWSARRRITTPDPVSSSFSVLVDDRRRADGEARLLQFEDQVAELLDAGQGGSVPADASFGLLPPVGFLPVNATSLRELFDELDDQQPDLAAAVGAPPPAQPLISVVSTTRAQVLRSLLVESADHLDAVKASLATTSNIGFDIQAFFKGFGEFGGFLDWEVADFALRQSWYNAAVFTNSTELRLKYYLVLQNVAAAVAANSATRGLAAATSIEGRSRLYVVFIKDYSWVSGAQVPVQPTRSLVPLREVLKP